MPAMVIDFWTHFRATPLFFALQWSFSIMFLPYVCASLINRRAVKGTRRSYQSATIIKTLIWPLFAGYVFCAVMDLFTHEWVGAFIDAWVCWTLLRDWERFKDSDDWWKGKGKKLKKKLRSMFTASSPSMAGAGA